jgi:hypothetical protein
MYIDNNFLYYIPYIGAPKKSSFEEKTSIQLTQISLSTLLFITIFSDVLLKLGRIVVSFFSIGVPLLSIFARKANHKFITKFVMVLALSACFPSFSIATPSEVGESATADCHFLGKVEGSSGYGKNTGWQALAKYSALDRAEKLGASHVVWEQMVPVGAFNGIAVARAYTCKI